MVPAAHGGTGARLFHTIIAVEELARVDPAVAVLVDVQNTLVATALDRWGTPAIHARHLPALATGHIGAYALSEAGSGSDAFALQTRATRDGDGFRIDGRKLWITNAREADVFIVFATVDPEAGHHGITAFVVPRETPGLSVGRKEDKLGIRASSTAEVVLDHCWVSQEAVLGEVGRGYRVAIETLNEGRIGIGAQMVGLAAGALHAAIHHTRDRRQFGRPVVEFQAVQFQLARAAMEIESARLLVYNAARLRDRGRPFVTEAAMAKLHASEVAERTASLAVNLCGGSGFVTGSPVEKFYRDAKIGQIYEGTSNMQLHTIARGTLPR
jgi:alkylation response protein AidB-like acyl-CoA dehydrogenase